MKDLDKKKAYVDPPEDEKLNESTPKDSALDNSFGLDYTLADEPVLEKDYFTFNIQDIIKAVNEHEASGSVSEPEPEIGLTVTVEPESEQESEPEPIPKDPEPEMIDNEEPESISESESIDSEEPEAISESESVDGVQPELAAGSEPELTVEPEQDPAPSPEIEPAELGTESEPDAEAEEPEPAAEDSEGESEPAQEPEFESESEPALEIELENSPADEPQNSAHKGSDLIARLKGQNTGTKRLVIVDIILLVVIIVSIAGGLVAANALVDKANAAKEQKIAAVQENIKEVDLTESLREYAADEVLDQIKVPTYTLDQLYALDLRKKTGFTEEDLKIITTRGLKGCEKAFVEAEEKYGVNSIFLISIASLESAYGTQMFRPNNMFGYGRTGFSSKSECIMTVAKGLGTRYLQPGASLYGGSPTLKGVNKRYAANPQWYYKVGKYMQRYYNELAAAKNGNVEKFE